MTQTSGSGRYNDRAGRNWETACARALNEHGFPAAERRGDSVHGRDLSGTWDVSVECTISEWAQIWRKLRQALGAAGEQALPYHCVWKRQKGKPDPMDGAVVTSPRVWWAMVARLEAYERAEMDAELEYRRGYRDGASGRAVEAAL